jgi:hypothetical protein
MDPLAEAPNRFDEISCNLDACSLLIRGFHQTVQDGLGNGGPLYMLADVSSHAHRFEQCDARDERHLERGHLFGERLKERWIKNGAREKEIYAQANLFLHIVKVQPLSQGSTVDVSSEGERGFSAQLMAREVPSFAKLLGGFQETRKVHIQDRLRFVVIPKRRIVSLEDEDVFKAQGRGIEEIGLKGQTITVTAGKVEDRFNSFSFK